MVILARAGEVWQSARLDVAWAVGFAQQVGLEISVRGGARNLGGAAAGHAA